MSSVTQAASGSRKEPWQMTLQEYRAVDSRLCAARKRLENAQHAIGSSVGGERFAGARVTNQLNRLDKARRSWSIAYDRADKIHRQAIVEAVEAGREVPHEVLRDYPDLRARAQSIKKPWQMTRKEWEAAISVVTNKGARRGISAAVQRTRELERLLDGVCEWRKKQLPQSASSDEIESTDGAVFHRDVIAKALSEGKPVSAEVVAEYPEYKTAIRSERPLSVQH